MKHGWTKVALGEVLKLDIDAVAVDPIRSYPFAGVYGFGRGLFMRDVVRGNDTTYSYFHRLHEGQLVMSQPKGWEGAISVVTAEFDGRFLSSVFPTFKADTDRVSTGFLRMITKCKWLWDALLEKSSGMGARRNSVYPANLFEVHVPLPPLGEQQRIVAHLNAVEGSLARVRELRGELRMETQALTISLHHQLAKDRLTKLNDLIELDEEQETVKPAGSYPQVGIRSFGQGMFRKSATAGTATTYRAFNVLRAGKLVMSQVKGWEGAVAVCPPDLDGWYVSPEYRTFSCREGACDSVYLGFIVRTPWFQKHLASATRGAGARRERIRPEMLLGIEIPYPDIAGQHSGVSTLARLNQSRAMSEEIGPLSDALLASLLDRVFNGGTGTPNREDRANTLPVVGDKINAA